MSGPVLLKVGHIPQVREMLLSRQAVVADPNSLIAWKRK